jgi:NAD(P)-dependent dehydrogenase (short-subunit alcohol dehydrogenase family)
MGLNLHRAAAGSHMISPALEREATDMAGRLKGKVALVSGGATGMGAAAARAIAAEGAKVAIVDRNTGDGNATAAAIRADGGEAIFAEADVTSEAAVNQAVTEVVRHLGPVTALFNHAGSIVIKPFLQTTLEEWESLHAINVRSMFLMTKAVLPSMIGAGGGAIVCTSSISAVAATATEVLYDTTKGACHMFARAIAVEFRDQGVRCNAICPGFIDTPHGQREVAGLTRYGVDVSDATIAMQQGRMGKPEDIAGAVVFLLSDESAFITGTHLFVDNGFTAV